MQNPLWSIAIAIKAIKGTHPSALHSYALYWVAVPIPLTESGQSMGCTLHGRYNISLTWYRVSTFCISSNSYQTFTMKTICIVYIDISCEPRLFNVDFLAQTGF